MHVRWWQAGVVALFAWAAIVTYQGAVRTSEAETRIASCERGNAIRAFLHVWAQAKLTDPGESAQTIQLAKATLGRFQLIDCETMEPFADQHDEVERLLPHHGRAR